MLLVKTCCVWHVTAFSWFWLIRTSRGCKTHFQLCFSMLELERQTYSRLDSSLPFLPFFLFLSQLKYLQTASSPRKVFFQDWKWEDITLNCSAYLYHQNLGQKRKAMKGRDLRVMLCYSWNDRQRSWSVFSHRSKALCGPVGSNQNSKTLGCWHGDRGTLPS